MVNFPPAIVLIIFLQSSPVCRGLSVITLNVFFYFTSSIFWNLVNGFFTVAELSTQFSVSISAASNSDQGLGPLRNKLKQRFTIDYIDIQTET